MWGELSDKPGHALSEGYGEMTMKGSRKDRIRWSRQARSIYVPLQMFFTRSSGNALPLIALSFHGVSVSVHTPSLNLEDIIVQYQNGSGKYQTYIRAGHSSPNTKQPLVRIATSDDSPDNVEALTLNNFRVKLSLGYVYLGVAERNKFAEASFEMLIDQVQKASDQLVNGSELVTMENIGFNHTVQELLWSVTVDKGQRELQAIEAIKQVPFTSLCPTRVI